jgi:hypothetical protein
VARFVDLLTEHERNYAAQATRLDVLTSSIRDNDAKTTSLTERAQKALERRVRAREETAAALAAAHELRTEVPRTAEGRALLERRRARAVEDTRDMIAALKRSLAEHKAQEHLIAADRASVDADAARVTKEHAAFKERADTAFAAVSAALSTARAHYSSLLEKKVQNARMRDEAVRLDLRIGPLLTETAEHRRVTADGTAEAAVRSARVASLRARLSDAVADARSAWKQAQTEDAEAAALAAAMHTALGDLATAQADAAQMRAAVARGQAYFEQHKQALGFARAGASADAATAVGLSVGFGAVGAAPSGGDERAALALRVAALDELKRRAAAPAQGSSAGYVGHGTGGSDESTGTADEAQQLLVRAQASALDDDADISRRLHLTPLGMGLSAVYWARLNRAQRRAVKTAFLERDVAVRTRRGAAWTAGAAPYTPVDAFRAAPSVPAARADAGVQCEVERFDFAVQTPVWLMYGFEADETETAQRREDLGSRVGPAVAAGAGTTAAGAGASGRRPAGAGAASVSASVPKPPPGALPTRRPAAGLDLGTGASGATGPGSGAAKK